MEKAKIKFKSEQDLLEENINQLQQLMANMNLKQEEVMMDVIKEKNFPLKESDINDLLQDTEVVQKYGKEVLVSKKDAEVLKEQIKNLTESKLKEKLGENYGVYRDILSYTVTSYVNSDIFGYVNVAREGLTIPQLQALKQFKEGEEFIKEFKESSTGFKPAMLKVPKPFIRNTTLPKLAGIKHLFSQIDQKLLDKNFVASYGIPIRPKMERRQGNIMVPFLKEVPMNIIEEKEGVKTTRTVKYPYFPDLKEYALGTGRLVYYAPRYHTVPYDVRLLTDWSAKAYSDYRVSSLASKDSLALAIARHELRALGELLTVAKLFYFGNGTFKGQVGRHQKCMEIAKLQLRPLEGYVGQWNYGSFDFKKFLKFFKRSFPLKEDKDIIALDDNNVQNLNYKYKYRGFLVNNTSHPGIMYEGVTKMVKTRTGKGPKQIKRGDTIEGDVVLAKGMLTALQKLSGTKGGDKRFMELYEFINLMMFKPKEEVYEVAEFLTKTRNYWGTNVFAFIPAQLFFKPFSFMEHFLENPQSISLLGFSPLKGGMSGLFKILQSRVYNENQETIYLVFADNLFIFMPTLDDYVFASLDASKAESSCSKKFVNDAILLLNQYFYQNKNSTHGWQTYIKQILPNLLVGATSAIGEVQFRVPFMTSGVVGTGYLNTVKMASLVHLFTTTFPGKAPLLLYEEKIVMSPDFLGCCRELAIKMKIESTTYVYNQGNSKYKPGSIWRTDLLGYDMVVYEVAGHRLFLPILNKTRFQKALVFDRDSPSEWKRKMLSTELYEVMKLIKLRMMYVLGGWIYPGYESLIKHTCSTIKKAHQGINLSELGAKLSDLEDLFTQDIWDTILSNFPGLDEDSRHGMQRSIMASLAVFDIPKIGNVLAILMEETDYIKVFKDIYKLYKNGKYTKAQLFQFGDDRLITKNLNELQLDDDIKKMFFSVQAFIELSFDLKEYHKDIQLPQEIFGVKYDPVTSVKVELPAEQVETRRLVPYTMRDATEEDKKNLAQMQQDVADGKVMIRISKRGFQEIKRSKYPFARTLYFLKTKLQEYYRINRDMMNSVEKEVLSFELLDAKSLIVFLSIFDPEILLVKPYPDLLDISDAWAIVESKNKKIIDQVYKGKTLLDVNNIEKIKDKWRLYMKDPKTEKLIVLLKS